VRECKSKATKGAKYDTLHLQGRKSLWLLTELVQRIISYRTWIFWLHIAYSARRLPVDSCGGPHQTQHWLPVLAFRAWVGDIGI